MSPTRPGAFLVEQENVLCRAGRAEPHDRCMVRTGRASFAQERLYFLDQLQPGNPAYVVAFAVHLRGALRPEALRTALTRVVARHDALRTTFAVVDGVLTQRVSSTPAVDVDITADGWVDRATQEAHLRTLVAEQARQPFDLADGPVVRAFLRSWGPDEHGLAVLVHHIACDGWSVGLLLRNLAAEYDATVDGSVAAYDDRPSPTWRTPSGSTRRGGGTARASTSGVRRWSTCHNWRCHRLPRPSVLGTTGGAAPPVEPDLVRRLGSGGGRGRDVVRGDACRVRLGAVPVRAPGRGGGRRSGCEPDGRGRERLVGCLVNTLPIRLDVSGRPSFTELVDRARRTSMAAFANQDVPFEQIVRATVGSGSSATRHCSRPR
ncbi:condensation domain-containing protein [Micromonospora sp. M12]